jgi:hypothetical protein
MKIMLDETPHNVTILAALLLFMGCGASTGGNGGGATPPEDGQTVSCPSGQTDVMQYFAMPKGKREVQFMNGNPNPIYTEVFPDQDFAVGGYWFWLKSAKAHGFDVKAFDQNYVYTRSTELIWNDNTTFKRFVHDLPIAARCVGANTAGPEIQVADTTFQYFSSCAPYKSSRLGTARNDLDAPVVMDTGGNIGRVPTRILHYRYNCDVAYQDCVDEEQFFLAMGYGLWQWKHYQNGGLAKSATMNNITTGFASATLPCPQNFE